MQQKYRKYHLKTLLYRFCQINIILLPHNTFKFQFYKKIIAIDIKVYHWYTMCKYKTYIRSFCKENSISFQEMLFDLKEITTAGLLLQPPVPENKVVIFFHSLGADKYFSFIELFTLFLKLGFTVCSIDWNGHGTENSHYMTYPESVMTPRLITEWFSEHYNIPGENIYFLGHSLGGTLCLHEAAQNRYGGLITISTPHSFTMGGRVLWELLSVLHKDSWRQLCYYSLWELLPAFHTFKRKQYPIRSLPEDRHYIKNVTALLKDINILNNIHDAETPYLNIHGTLDAIISYKESTAICQNYGGPVQHIKLRRNNHFTTIYNRKTVQAIATWIDSREDI